MIFAAACSGDDGGGVEKAQLRRMVLQQSDVGAQFTRFDEGPQARADAPSDDRADAKRFGREGGWKARFRRSGSIETKGPLVVESRADVFADADGAETELEAHEEELREDATLLDSPAGLGEAAVVATTVQGSAPAEVRYYTVAWRRGNVTASVAVNGFAGGLARADAVRLARAQDRRMERAARE